MSDLTQEPKYIAVLLGYGTYKWMQMFDVENSVAVYCGWAGSYTNKDTLVYSQWITNMSSSGFTYVNKRTDATSGYTVNIFVYY